MAQSTWNRRNTLQPGEKCTTHRSGQNLGISKIDEITRLMKIAANEFEGIFETDMYRIYSGSNDSTSKVKISSPVKSDKPGSVCGKCTRNEEKLYLQSQCL